MTIHLSGALLDWILDHLPSAATYREGGRWDRSQRLWGAAVVLEEGLAPNSGYWLADDGRRLGFVLDGAGIHPRAEGVRAQA
jgi:hypothetical protein